MSIMIIDGNSIAYAAQSAAPLTVDGMEVQGIFHSIKTLRTMLFGYPKNASKVYWLWDHRAQWRFDLCPEYKGKRKDTQEKIEVKVTLENAKPLLEEMLQSLGIDQVFSVGYEADDVAGFLSRRAAAAQRDTLLVTGDQDWIQLVGTFVKWIDARSKEERFCNRANFAEYTGVDNPKAFLQMKALQGDTSDNIKGVGGIGKLTARAIMDHFGSVEELYLRITALSPNTILSKEGMPKELQRAWKPIQALFGENWERYQTNYRLMDLQTTERDADIAKNMTVIKGEYNPELFIEQCEKLNFYSIIRGGESWLMPFQPNARRRAA